MIPKETIDSIFEQARVEDVIGDFVTLKRAGQNLKGFSPFVNEKTPSFIVSPAKQIWKDFSTGKGGTVVGFLMELESYTYPEALRYLAKRYNIEINEGELDEESLKAANTKESMFLVSEYATKYFHHNLLNSKEGKDIGLSYFKERGFSEETIEAFRLGYSLDKWTAFTESAENKGYKLEFLTSTGLTIESDNNKKFDRFKGRVMFPIQSISGRILGFGARTLLNNKKTAKYLNSPESLIYHKSDVLYGIYQAKGNIIKESNCYLVEGYTDVISLHQNGVKNVVASSGTALTTGQINLIKRFTSSITVLYDGDEAGIKASFRGIDLILEQDMDVKVLTFPDGHDPDSFAKSVSTSELQAYLQENATDFIKFKTKILLDEVKDDPIKRSSLIRDIVKSISKIDNDIKREIYIQETSKLLNIRETTISNELAQVDENKRNKRQRKEYVRKETNTSSVIKPSSSGDTKILGEDVVELELMKLLLIYGDFEIDIVEDNLPVDENKRESILFKTTVLQEIVERLREDELFFSDPVKNEIYEEIVDGFEKEEFRLFKYFMRHQNQQIVSFAVSVSTEKHELSPNWKKKNIFVLSKEERLSQATQETILRFKERKITEKIKNIAEKLKTLSDSKEIERTIIDLKKITALRNRINIKLNRVL